MSAEISRLDGRDAYDLIYPEHLSMLSTLDQETILRAMTNSSRVWLGYDDHKILCIWGLIPPTLLSDRAYLWMHTTKHLQHHTFLLVRHSQRVVEDMLKEYPIIVGHCKCDNVKARRWLRWLGAEFLEPQDSLIPFEIKAGA